MEGVGSPLPVMKWEEIVSCKTKHVTGPLQKSHHLLSSSIVSLANAFCNSIADISIQAHKALLYKTFPTLLQSSRQILLY